MKLKHTDKPYTGLEWIERIAFLLDSKFTFPGTRFKFGIDPIIGLIPFLGDITSFTISGSLILYMAKKGVSQKVLILMILNVVIDTILGAIPIIGNVFDFAYKANNRNIKLLRKHYVEGKYQGSGTGVLVSIAVVLIILLLMITFLFGWLIRLIIGLF